MSKRINDLTWGEFINLGYQKKFAVLPVVISGWPHQCRCGAMRYVKYRGRFYCQRCGNRHIHCAYKVIGKPCHCPLLGTS